MRMWCAKPVGATHHGRLHNAQASEWREGLDRPGRGHPDLAGIYQPGNMTIDARKKKKKLWYKLLIQVYKALNGLAPEYIVDLLQEYVPTRALRSAGAYLLLEPKTTTRRGAQAFSKSAPVLRNTLPSTVKTAASLAFVDAYCYNILAPAEIKKKL